MSTSYSAREAFGYYKFRMTPGKNIFVE